MTSFAMAVLVVFLVAGISVQLTSAADEEDYPPKPTGYVLPWLFPEYIRKRGCVSYGEPCKRTDTCCKNLYCNTATGTCEECVAKGHPCTFFSPCCSSCKMNKNYEEICD